MGVATAGTPLSIKRVGLFITPTLFTSAILLGNEIDVFKLSDAQWQGILDLTRNIGDRLFTSVDGNHFFFMGEGGARATADAIEQLENKVHAVKKELSTLIGTEIQ